MSNALSPHDLRECHVMGREVENIDEIRGGCMRETRREKLLHNYVTSELSLLARLL